MKILFIVTYYYPHWTGLTQYARRLAEGLTKRGHDVSVLTTKHQNDLKSDDLTNGVKIFRKRVVAHLSRTLISLDLVFSFWKQIRSTDRIIVYLPFAEVSLVAIVAKILSKKLFLVHNGDLTLPKGVVNSAIERLYYLSTKLAIALSEGIIIQTEDYANNSPLLSEFRNKWQVVLPLYEKTKEGKGFTKILESRLLKGKKYIVGFAGRLVGEKGFDILFQAMPLVAKAVPQIQYLFAGEMHIPYENFYQKNERLIQESKKYFSSTGRLNESEIASFYRLCDAIVISSRTDCFPSVEVEALLAGIPVVVTDIPGARWPVQQTGMGVVVQKENPRALADGILEVLKNKSRYVKNAESAAKIFDYEKTLEKYEAIICI